MTETGRCTECGAELQANAPRGLCPKCLLRAGLGDVQDAANLHIRCPHCQNPVEVVHDAPLTDISCPSCGSHFSLVGEPTITYEARESKTIGHFDLLNTIGTGAFGTVWKARDTQLDRAVAVKIPRKGQLSAAESEQFLREARAAAQLRHPNIVSVHEIGRENSQLYIVSDFVEGISLADWLTGHRATPREAAEVCVKIAEALHYAHQAGVIHRDLKPSNTMLDAQNEPHIMDFGLAKREAGEITMTIEGKVLGTPAYMSPEQAKGEAHTADARSDLYSMGVILFELLTGERPFRGNNRMLIHQVLNDEPRPPRRINDLIPRDLETICLKAMAKEPGRRYGSARDFADDLRRWLNGEPIRARPVGRLERIWRWCRRNQLVAGLSASVLVSLVAIAVVSMVSAVRIARQNRQVREYAGRVEKLATESTRRLARMNVAEGTRRVDSGNLLGALPSFVEALRLEEHDPKRASVHRIRIQSALNQCPRLLAEFRHASAVRHGTFSPDGQLVVTASDDKTLRVWEVATGRSVAGPFVHDGPVRSAEFSADGHYVLSVSSHGHMGEVRLWDLRSGQLAIAPLRHEKRVQRALLSPDNSRIVTASTFGSGKDYYSCTVRLWNARAGEHIRDLGSGSAHYMEDLAFLTLSPDGKRVGVAIQGAGPGDDEDRLSVRVFDTQSGESLVPTITLARARATASNMTWLCFNLDGTQLATARTVSSDVRDYECQLEVWEIASGKKVGLVTIPRDEVKDFGFSTDGKHLVAVRDHGSLWVARISDGVRVRGFRESPPVLTEQWVAPDRLYVAPHRLHIAVLGELDLPRIWNLATGKPITPVLRHANRVTHVAFHPRGHQVLTTSTDGTARLWDITVEQDTTPPLEHFWPTRVGYGYLHVWPSKHRIDNTYLNKDGSRILAQDAFGTFQLWDVINGKPMTPERPLLRPSGSAVPTPYFQLSPDCGHVYFVSSIGRVMHTDMISGHTRKVLELNDNRSDRVTMFFSQDSTRTAILDPSEDGKTLIRFIEIQSGAEVAAPYLCDGYVKVQHVEFAPDGQSVVVATNTPRTWSRVPHEVHLVRIESGTRRVPLEGGPGSSYKAATLLFTPDGRRLIVAANRVQDRDEPRREPDGWMAVFDAASGRSLASPIQFPDAFLNDAACSPDGRLIVTTVNSRESKFADQFGNRAERTDWGATQVWDAETGQPITGPIRHPDHCAAVFALGGRRVITSCGDGTIRIWEAETGQLAAPPISLRGNIGEIAVTASGTLFATMFATGLLRIWDVHTAEPVTPIFDSGGLTTKPVFTAQDALLVTDDLASVGNFARAGSLEPTRATTDELARHVRWLAAETAAFPETAGHPARSEELPAEPAVVHPKWLATGAAAEQRRLAWHRQTAYDCVELHYWDGALFHLNALINLDPEVPQFWVNRALVFDKLDKFEPMIADCGRVLELASGDPSALILRGETYAGLGKWPQAAHDFARLAELLPYDLYVRITHARLQLRTGNAAEHRRICEQLLRDEEVMESKNQADYVIWTCLLSPEPPEIQRILALAKEKSRKWKDPRRWRSDRSHYGAALLRAGQIDDAITSLEKAQQEVLPAVQEPAPIQALLALVYEQAGRKDEAAVMRKKVQSYVKSLGQRRWEERLDLELLLQVAR